MFKRIFLKFAIIGGVIVLFSNQKSEYKYSQGDSGKGITPDR